MSSTRLTKEDIRKAAEEDLWTFAKLVNYNYCYGDLHERVFRWFSSGDAGMRQLLLLPRGHLKSHCIATWVAWQITKRPWVSIVYLSAGDDLTKGQVYAIQNMISSDIYRRYWPTMTKPEEGKRARWSAYEIIVDHPARKNRGIRDSTLIGKTVKSNFTGLHADIIVFDDVVVPNNAYTEIGRGDVKRSLSQCTSILNAGGCIKAVGTRYHPQDAYFDMQEAVYKLWDEAEKEFISEEPLWDILEEVVEDEGDGTGNFLWPRTKSSVTEDWFGFDIQQLEIVRADYFSKGEQGQFYAQYYNNPNDDSTHMFDRSLFQYYDPKFITNTGGSVAFKGKRLNVFAAMDVAWTDISAPTAKTADYTAIAVVGVDEDGYYYILDLDRFKTSNFQMYYDNVISLSSKWGFRKIMIETNAGGKLVAQEIERLARQAGGSLSVEKKANAGFGSKSKIMRQYAVVNPKYELRSIFHRRDGLFSALEEELILERPPHDDLVDALGMALEFSKPPMKTKKYLSEDRKIVTDVRFGGRRSR